MQSTVFSGNPKPLRSLFQVGESPELRAMWKNTTDEIESPRNDEGDSSSPLLFQGTDSITPSNPMKTSFLDDLLEPMTIFYDGKVNAYMLPRERAAKIMRWVESNFAKVNASASKDGRQLMPSPLLDSLRRDMPLTRKKSLETFLLRRKARLSSGNPQLVSLQESFNININPNDRKFGDKDENEA